MKHGVTPQTKHTPNIMDLTVTAGHSAHGCSWLYLDYSRFEDLFSAHAMYFNLFENQILFCAQTRATLTQMGMIGLEIY
jgi:hypothetical protein